MIRSRAFALAITAALSTQGCTVAIPVTLGIRASDHNQRIDRAEADARMEARIEALRGGAGPLGTAPTPAATTGTRQSVGARVVGGVVLGLVVDYAVMAALTIAMFSQAGDD